MFNMVSNLFDMVSMQCYAITKTRHDDTHGVRCLFSLRTSVSTNRAALVLTNSDSILQAMESKQQTSSPPSLLNSMISIYFVVHKIPR